MYHFWMMVAVSGLATHLVISQSQHELDFANPPPLPAIGTIHVHVHGKHYHAVHNLPVRTLLQKHQDLFNPACKIYVWYGLETIYICCVYTCSITIVKIQ